MRMNITEEELIYWAAFFDLKNEREKREHNRQKANTR